MRNPLFKRHRREFFGNLGKYVGIFLMMTFAVSFTSGFLLAASSIETIVGDMKQTYRIEDGRFACDFEPKEEALAAVRELGVTLYPDFYKQVGTTLEGGDNADGITCRVYPTRTDVNLPAYAQGRAPASPHEIAFDRVFCENHKLEVGNAVLLGDSEFTICGILTLPDYQALFENNNSFMFNALTFAVAVVDPAGYKDLGSMGEVYNYTFVFDDQGLSREQRTDVEERMMDALSDHDALLSNFIDADDNQGIGYALDDVQGDQAMWTVLLFLLVIIMGFVFVVLASATIEQESAVLGTLLASGWRKRELVRHYMFLPAVVGLLASVAGLALGVGILCDPFKDLYYHSYSLPPYHTIWNTRIVLITAVLPYLLLVGITLVGLLRNLRFTPLQFLRHEAAGRRRNSRLHLPEGLRYVTRFRVRVLARNASHFVTLFFGIMFASLLLLFGLCMLPVVNNYAQALRETVAAPHQYVLKTPLELEGTDEDRAAYAAVLRLAQDKERMDANRPAIDALERLQDNEPLADALERLQDNTELMGAIDRLQANSSLMDAIKRLRNNTELMDAAERLESKRELTSAAERLESKQGLVDAMQRLLSKQSLVEAAQRLQGKQNVVEAAQRLASKQDLVAAAQRLQAKQDVVEAAQRLSGKQDVVAAAQRLQDKQDVVAAVQQLADKQDVVAAAQRLQAQPELVAAAQRMAAGAGTQEDAALLAQTDDVTKADLELALTMDEQTRANIALATTIDEQTQSDMALMAAVDDATRADLALAATIDDATKADMALMATVDDATKADMQVVAGMDDETKADMQTMASADEQTLADLQIAATIDEQTREDMEVAATIDAQTQNDMQIVANMDSQTRNDLQTIAQANEQARADLELVSNLNEQTRADLELLTKAQGQTKEDLELLTDLDEATQNDVDLVRAMDQDLLDDLRLAADVDEDAHVVNTQENSAATVAQTEKYAMATVEIERAFGGEREEVSVYGIQPNSAYWTAIPVANGTVVAGRGLTEKTKAQVGAPITMLNRREGKEYDVTIAQEASNAADTNLYMSIDDFNQLFGNDADYFNAYASAEELALDDRYVATSIVPEDMDDISNQMQESMGNIMTMMMLMAVPIYLILLYLLTKTVIDRSSRSISYMKVFGYHSGEVDGLYIHPITLFVLFSLLASIPLIIALLTGLLKVVFSRYAGNFPINIPPDRLALLVLVGMAAYAAVAALHVRRIRKVPLSLALKVQE